MVASESEILQIGQSIALCMLSIVTWDALVCIKLEYRLVWKKQWNLMKILYLLSRYSGIIAHAFTAYAFTAIMNANQCARIVKWVPGLSAICVLSANGILALRTFAIYSRPKWMVGLIVLLFSLELSFMVWATIEVQSALPAGVDGPCFPSATHPLGQGPNFAYFMFPFVLDLTFTGLSLYRAWSLARMDQGTEILTVFTRDGILYFLASSFIWVVEMAFYLQPVASLQSINAPIALGVSSMMSCRLVLSIRSFAEQRCDLSPTNLINVRTDSNVQDPASHEVRLIRIQSFMSSPKGGTRTVSLPRVEEKEEDDELQASLPAKTISLQEQEITVILVKFCNIGNRLHRALSCLLPGSLEVTDLVLSIVVSMR